MTAAGIISSFINCGSAGVGFHCCLGKQTEIANTVSYYPQGRKPNRSRHLSNLSVLPLINSCLNQIGYGEEREGKEMVSG